MDTVNSPLSKVARSRERMRSAGLRPVQFWVPDTRLEGFVSDVRLQCLALKGDTQELEAQEFAQEALRHVNGWA
jgi:hypothetical protein